MARIRRGLVIEILPKWGPLSASRFTRAVGRGTASLRAADRQSARGKEAQMVPLLLWILGVPGLLIILLLLLGVIHI